MSRPESKYWCFTVFAEDCPWRFGVNDVQYVCYGREVCPDTQRRHLQGFVAFGRKKRLTAIKKIDPAGHYEMKRGTVSEAVAYCKKDGDVHEEGDLPSDDSGVAVRKCIQYARAGDMKSVEELSPALFLRYKRTFEGLRKFDLPVLTEPTGYWIHGLPGSSKDSNVLKLQPFVKSHNKWWDGYEGQKYVLLSDLDTSTAKWVGHFLKIWSDMHPFNAEIKGGVMTIRPERFYVTSNYTIDCLFSDDMNLCNALKRRFHVIDFDNNAVQRRAVVQHVDKLSLIDF